MSSTVPHPEPNSKPYPVVCVFCGASPGDSDAHLQAARALAQALHDSNTHLVYGGGTLGVMGALAQELVRLSGPDSVTGIIPRALMQYEQQGVHKVPSASSSPTTEKTAWPKQGEEVDEVPNPKQWGNTIVVPTMHARKSLMASHVLSGSRPGSGFVALSGGYGTLEELMEVVTWNQIGIHDAPIIMFNVAGYYDGILAWIKRAVGEKFISAPNAHIIVEATTADEVIKGLVEYVNSQGKMKLKWGEK